MALHTTGNQVHARHHTQLAIAVLHQLGITKHGLQAALETDFSVFIHLQQGGDLLELHGLAMVVEHFQDQLPAGDGVLVIFGLTIGMGVAVTFLGGIKLFSERGFDIRPSYTRMHALSR